MAYGRPKKKFSRIRRQKSRKSARAGGSGGKSPTEPRREPPESGRGKSCPRSTRVPQRSSSPRIRAPVDRSRNARGNQRRQQRHVATGGHCRSSLTRETRAAPTAREGEVQADGVQGAFRSSWAGIRPRPQHAPEHRQQQRERQKRPETLAPTEVWRISRAQPRREPPTSRREILPAEHGMPKERPQRKDLGTSGTTAGRSRRSGDVPRQDHALVARRDRSQRRRGCRERPAGRRWRGASPRRPRRLPERPSQGPAPPTRRRPRTTFPTPQGPRRGPVQPPTSTVPSSEPRATRAALP